MTETPVPTETSAPTGDGIILSLDTSKLTVDTVYTAENPISDVVGVGLATDGGAVTVVNDDVKGNVLELKDTGAGQTSLKFDLANSDGSAKSGVIQYNLGFNYVVDEADIASDATILKDLTLARLSNKNYAGTLPVSSDDGRVAEITTVANGTVYQLVVKDYYTADSNGKANSNKTSINLKPNTWYDIYTEFDANTNIVKIYAKDTDGNVVASDKVTLTATADAPIAVTNASIMTKGSQTVPATVYVESPSFSIAKESMELPDVDDSDVPWTKGVNDSVISETTMINFSEVNSVYDFSANFGSIGQNISDTIAWGDITVYMDPDRDLEWQDNGGTPEDHGNSGAGGKMEYSQRKYTVPNYETNFNMGIGGSYSSLFEGMMAKTADGNPVYLIKDEDGTVRRELRIREIDDKIATGVTAYDKDGNEIDLTTLPEQTEKFTGAFEKVIGVKVSGPCTISVVSAANGGRCLMISDSEGNILNPNDDPSLLGTVPVVDDNDGTPWVIGQYTGEGPTEIFISCQAGGLCVNAINIEFNED